MGKTRMRIRGIAIVVLRLAAVGPCLAEMAPPPPTQSGFEIDRSASRLPSFIDLSPSISRETQVPLGTILTDAITKMTPQGIQSGLERTPSVWGFPVPELSPELARSSAPSVAAAL